MTARAHVIVVAAITSGPLFGMESVAIMRLICSYYKQPLVLASMQTRQSCRRCFGWRRQCVAVESDIFQQGFSQWIEESSSVSCFRVSRCLFRRKDKLLTLVKSTMLVYGLPQDLCLGRSNVVTYSLPSPPIQGVTCKLGYPSVYIVCLHAARHPYNAQIIQTNVLHLLKFNFLASAVRGIHIGLIEHAIFASNTVAHVLAYVGWQNLHNWVSDG